jgi:hypothetical protein
VTDEGQHDEGQHEATHRAMHLLSRWRTLFAGWQLGTRLDTDAEAAAVRDHREATLFCRAELTAITTLLLDKQVFTQDEFLVAMEREAALLNMALADRFPGVTAHLDGLHMEPQRVAKWMRKQHWKP